MTSSSTSRRCSAIPALVFAILVLATWTVAAQVTEKPAAAGEPYVYTHWETFYAEEDGLPNDHIFALTADGDRLWVGTEDGLALYEDKTWRSWREKDGLPWRVVSAIAVSEKTGDVWVGLLGGGLARFSGGRFDHFNQFNSGLVNDVVYGVAVLDDTVWVATTAGMSALNTVTGEWEIYTEKNAPMEEIWCYNVDAGDGKVYAAVWGGGILEWDVETRRWNAHRDPDREMEIDLYRDDGLIHIITTSASYVDEVLWASTYFGLSRYDGRHWRGWMDHDSGLASNFINIAKGRSGTSCYSATDYGVAVLSDFATDTWVSYRRETEDAETWTAYIGTGNEERRTVVTDLSLPNHFVIALEFQGDDLWIGTGHGLARGVGKGFFEGLSKAEASPREEEGR
jgi:ligand-binding sensor domain-containing protein